MDAVLRAAAIYVGLMLVLRLFGKRSMAQVTVFDFVLLLIIAEATQQALLGNDFSITNALLVILTLVSVDRLLDYAQNRWNRVSKVTQSVPIVLVENGEPMEERMAREAVSVDDVMEQARLQRGLENLSQVKYAVLERSGTISIIARDPHPAGRAPGPSAPQE